MVYVKLERDWTDEVGRRYRAGQTVDVDAVTLANLEAQGLVTEPVGEADPSSWGEPTGTEPGTNSWGEPTGGGGTSG